ncbi:hypothetical protein [Halomontanus rarus]|uniref:hypothetical protein n=1 Tax=Halomontanus rarus TaxID=3034020 RepID=UPI0023E76006|nr:hypothetical protein [Halovivax sp. TS33]
MASETGRFRTLEVYAPELILVGAVLYAVFVASEILVTYSGTAIPQDTTFASVGGNLVVIGLLGFYPVLVERRPYLSRAAVILAVIAVIAWSIVVLGTGILKPLGILTEPPGPLALTPLVGMATLYSAYALLGIAVLLVDAHPRTVGVLLLVAAVSVPLVRLVLTGLPNFVANVVNLLAYIGIGVVLLTADVPTDGVEPLADTPA